MKTENLTGKIAFVTGASKGIGSADAELHRAGSRRVSAALLAAAMSPEPAM
jgi:NAD(P)-dependent dehydrogenase (short-subunit alcohol dehydrogenase family)